MKSFFHVLVILFVTASVSSVQAKSNDQSSKADKNRTTAQERTPKTHFCVAPAVMSQITLGDLRPSPETSSLYGEFYYNPVYPGRPVSELASLKKEEVEKYFLDTHKKFDGIYRIGLSILSDYGKNGMIPKEIFQNPKKYFFEPIYKSLISQGVDSKKIEIMMISGEGNVTTLKKHEEPTKEEAKLSCAEYNATADYRSTIYWSQKVRQLIYKIHTIDDYVKPPEEKLGYLEMYDHVFCHVKYEQMCDEYRNPRPEKR